MLFACNGCDSPHSRAEVPLCLDCEKRLTVIPLFSVCADCRRPISSAEKSIHLCLPPELSLNRTASGEKLWTSIQALFPLQGLPQKILREHKKRPHAGMDRLLRERLSRSPPIPGIPDRLIPIGQSYARRWQLHGGSGARLARLLSDTTRIPISEGLLPRHSVHQARQSGLDRYLTKLDFRWSGEPLARKNVVLVDDFLTSGRTLRLASERLYAEGVASVSVVVAGIRFTPSA